MPVLTSFVAACHVAEGLPGSMSRRKVWGEVLGDSLRGLRRPVTTLMLVVALFCGGLPALEKMCVDIFPSLIHVK